VFELKYSSIIKILISLPFSLVVLCLIFYLWWSRLNTGADNTGDGSLGDHLGW